MSGWDADTHEDEIWRESLELLPVSNWHHLNATCCCATLVEIPATDHPADERPTSYSSQLYKQTTTLIDKVNGKLFTHMCLWGYKTMQWAERAENALVCTPLVSFWGYISRKWSQIICQINLFGGKKAVWGAVAPPRSLLAMYLVCRALPANLFSNLNNKNLINE